MSPITSSDEWKRSKPYIEQALAFSGLYQIQDVERGVNEGAYQFWPGRHSAAVTEFALYPNGKALNVFAGGGETGPAIKELTEGMERCFVEWAKAADCKWVLGYGRRGWERVLKPLGYRHLWSVLAKEIA